jgi:hypothetical protein
MRISPTNSQPFGAVRKVLTTFEAAGSAELQFGNLCITWDVVDYKRMGR